MQWVLLKEVFVEGKHPELQESPVGGSPLHRESKTRGTVVCCGYQNHRKVEGTPRPGPTAGPAARPRSPGRRPGSSAGGAGRRARSAAAAAASPDLPARPGGAVSRDRPALAPRAAPEAAGVPDASRSRRLSSRRPDARPGEERREVRPLGPAGRAAAAGWASGGARRAGSHRCGAGGGGGGTGRAGRSCRRSRGELPGDAAGAPRRPAGPGRSLLRGSRPRAGAGLWGEGPRRALEAGHPAPGGGGGGGAGVGGAAGRDSGRTAFPPADVRHPPGPALFLCPRGAATPRPSP